LQSIENLLTLLGLTYKIIGDEAVSPCPFHSPDKHPSFSCNIRSGLYHCFTCGASGNLAHLISELKHLSYTEAVIYVNSVIGWAKSEKWREDQEHKNYAPPSLKISETDLALFTDPPQELLDARRITLPRAQQYGVQYSPDKDSWILPIRNPYNNELWGWQEKHASTRYFKNHPRGIRKSKTLFGYDTAANGSPVILVESGLDAVRVSDFGEGTGVASWGVQVSDYHLALIQQCTEHLILALDRDSDGLRETARICRDFKSIRITVFDYGMSTAKDAGDMTDEEVVYALDNAKSALKWLRENDIQRKTVPVSGRSSRTSGK
jgi:DNA primase